LNYLDYTLLVIVFIGFILGFKDGLVRKIIGLFGLIIGIALAIEYSDDLGSILTPIFNQEAYLAEIVAAVLIFLMTIAIASVIKRLVHPSDKVNKFVNQFLGGLAGVLQLLFIISGFLLFLNIFNFPNEKDRENSLIYNSIYRIVPSTIDFIIGSDVKSKEFIKEYIEGNDEFEPFEEADSLKGN